MIYMSICDCFACHLNYVFLYLFMLSGSCKYLCIYSVRSLNWKRNLLVVYLYAGPSQKYEPRIQTLLFCDLSMLN